MSVYIITYILAPRSNNHAQVIDGDLQIIYGLKSVNSTEFGSVISAEGSSINTAEFSASRTSLDGSAHMIQVRQTTIQLCYAQAKQALQVQPNFTQHVPHSHS